MRERRERMEQREFYSRVIKAGSRVYYLDAKTDSTGSNYLVISERRSSERSGGAGNDRQRIFVYEEDLAKFAEALLDVVGQVQQDSDHRGTDDRGVEKAGEVSIDQIRLDELDAPEGWS